MVSSKSILNTKLWECKSHVIDLEKSQMISIDLDRQRHCSTKADIQNQKTCQDPAIGSKVQTTVCIYMSFTFVGMSSGARRDRTLHKQFFKCNPQKRQHSFPTTNVWNGPGLLQNCVGPRHPRCKYVCYRWPPAAKNVYSYIYYCKPHPLLWTSLSWGMTSCCMHLFHLTKTSPRFGVNIISLLWHAKLP